MSRRRRRLKGPVRAIRLRPLRPIRVAHPVLTREAEEQLFRAAEVLSEGGSRDGVWFGSTMITIDLERLQAGLPADLGEEGRARLLEALRGSVRVRVRAMRIALAEVARRVPGDALGTAHVETAIHLHDGKLHVDIDLEVPLGVSSGRRR